MDPDTRTRRNTGYLLWMLAAALVPVGLNFGIGTPLQIFFLGLSALCFLISRIIVPKERVS
jgi:4-hydroxybenzoate polyprenyltransferase